MKYIITEQDHSGDCSRYETEANDMDSAKAIAEKIRYFRKSQLTVVEVDDMAAQPRVTHKVGGDKWRS